jgi:uncharacterized membrane protein
MTRRSWIWTAVLVALGLSVALNVFLAGYVVSSLREGAGVRMLAGTVARAYPAEVRQEFRNVLRENRANTSKMVRDLREARARLTETVNAMPFDEAATDQAMRDVRDATATLQKGIQGHLMTALKRTRQARAGK